MTEKEQKRALVWPPSMDPVSQAQLWVAQRLYPWQVRVLRDVERGMGICLAVLTPNESGKTSFLLPVAGLSFLAAFPGAQVVSTAGVERQIRKQLWPVLRATLARYPKWQITEELSITAPAVRGLPPSTWEAFTTRDPAYAEGFHSRWYRDKNGALVYAPLMVIIDEAKSFTDSGMFDAFERCNPDVWLVVSTPGEDTGPFFECFNLFRGEPWVCHEVSRVDCPHLWEEPTYSKHQLKIEKLGMDDPLVLSMIFGRFFRRGGRFIFEAMQDVEWAMSGMVPKIDGARKAALDFSGGGDEQVFVVRDGNLVLELRAFHESDTTILGDRFVELFKRWELKPENIIGDNGGLGKPCIDYLERKGWRGIRRYMADDKARDETLYVNRASEDHMDLKYRLQSKLIGLPADQTLKDQMRRRRYLMRNDDSNRVRVEPKEAVRNRGEPSPDRLDAVVMVFSDMPPMSPPEDRFWQSAGSPRCGRVADCFKREDDEESVFGHYRFED